MEYLIKNPIFIMMFFSNNSVFFFKYSNWYFNKWHLVEVDNVREINMAEYLRVNLYVAMFCTKSSLHLRT